MTRNSQSDAELGRSANPISSGLWSDPKFVAPLLICAAIHGILLTGTLFNNPAYLTDFRQNLNPDAHHYVVEGTNIWLRGKFSRCDSDPYVPDMLRTPIYPVFTGLFVSAGIPIALYCVQAALNVFSCGLVFVLARRLFTPWAGCLSAMLFATDMMVAISAFEAMSEVLFTFLTLVGLIVLVPRNSSEDKLPTPGASAICGLVLAAATLTRPAGLYIPFVAAGLLILYAIFKSQGRQGAVAAVSLLVCFAIPVSLWIVRNKVVFDLARLSTADAIMTVYFAGAGAYQVKHGIGLEAAQAMISREYGLPSPTVTNNHWIADLSVREMDEQLRAAQPKVLLKYPGALVHSSLIGIVKAHLSHNVGLLGEMLAIPWNPTSGGQTSQQNRIASLLTNSPLLIFACGWQLAHTFVTWSLFALGVYVLVSGFQLRWPTLLVAGTLAYFLLTVAIVGKEAYYRSRTPHMPLVYVVAGASAQLFKRSKVKFVR